MCSYWDKNIEPIFSEKLKNMKKCLNLQNLRTGEPQKKLLVLIKKNVCNSRPGVAGLVRHLLGNVPGLHPGLMVDVGISQTK